MVNENIVAHPLTEQNGEPKFTASDYRRANNSLLFPSDKTTFGSVSGIRWAIPGDKVSSMSGTTITINPHSGVISQWNNVGPYTYYVREAITVERPVSGDYYLTLSISDPSESHGETPGVEVTFVPMSTARDLVPGLILGELVGSTYTDYAVRLRNNMVIESESKEILDTIPAETRQKAYVRSGDGIGYWEYRGYKWFPMEKTVSIRPASGWESYEFSPLSALLTGGNIVIVSGAVRRTGESFTAGLGQRYEVATIDIPPVQRVDYVGAAIGTPLGTCAVRIYPDGIVYIDPTNIDGVPIKQDDTWVTINGTYFIG